MKKHVLRPLWVAIGLVGLILVARHLTVPRDFGVHGKSFTYNFYRLSDIADYKALPVKYRGKKVCDECHSDNFKAILASKHKIIQCENCHGPALNHPDDPEDLPVNRSRQLCLRCHAHLAYPGSQRSKIESIDPGEHNPGKECVECHNPHNPNLEDME